MEESKWLLTSISVDHGFMLLRIFLLFYAPDQSLHSWPKSSFGFFHHILWTEWSFWSTQYSSFKMHLDSPLCSSHLPPNSPVYTNLWTSWPVIMLPMHILYFISLLSCTLSNCFKQVNLTPSKYSEILLHTDHMYILLQEQHGLGCLTGLSQCLWHYKHWQPPCAGRGRVGDTDSPSSWLAEEVVRLNCCSRYFPKKAAKPATTAISMQAARMIQVNTGFESRCLVTLGITAGREADDQGHRSCTPRPSTPEVPLRPIPVNSTWLLRPRPITWKSAIIVKTLASKYMLIFSQLNWKLLKQEKPHNVFFFF